MTGHGILGYSFSQSFIELFKTFMKKLCLFLAAAVVSLGALNVQANVFITEIMYNPASTTDGSSEGPIGEWVEIYNSGASSVDVSGWYLDDEDASNWDPLGAGSILLPGEVAIIATNPTEFNQAWGSGIKVFGITGRGTMANTVNTASNELLDLKDSTGTVIDAAHYKNAFEGWPAGSNGKSIYLKNISLDNDIGANWALSASGIDGAFSPSTTVEPYVMADVGSPGVVVVPEPATAVLLGFGLAGLLIARRRN